MTNSTRYVRAFAKALAEHLRGNVPKFTDRHDGPGGCPTCGFGADTYDVVDMERLEAEIDRFATTFEQKKGGRDD